MTDTTSPQPKFYFPELDGLRLIAFLLVFVHHAPALNVPALRFVKFFGWIGVDLFFALSAFLFVKLLAREFGETGEISVKKFYIRRGLRIYPIYVIFCLLMIIVTSFTRNIGLMGWRIFGIFSFTDNIFSAFKWYNQIAFAGHLWTISFEEQFYVIVPFLLLFLLRASRSRVVTFLTLSAVAFTLLRALFIALHAPHPAIWVLPVTHFESILLGLVVGLGGFHALLSRVPSPLVLAGGFGSAWLMTRIGTVNAIGWHLMIVYPLIGIATSLVVYFVFRTGRAWWMKWLSVRPVVFLGKISYGLYVYHLLGIFLGNEIAMRAFRRLSPDVATSGNFIVSLLITIGISAVSYIYVEKPFLQMKRGFEIVASRPV